MSEVLDALSRVKELHSFRIVIGDHGLRLEHSYLVVTIDLDTKRKTITITGLTKEREFIKELETALKHIPVFQNYTIRKRFI